MNSIASKIKYRISRSKEGSIYTPSDFKDLGSSVAVRKELSRLVKTGSIDRVSHGIYIKPKQHKIFGKVAPNSEEIATLLAKKQGFKISPSSEYALNKLGLSTQVTMRKTYLTNGPKRHVKFGDGEIVFRPTASRKLAMKGELSSLLFLALEELDVNALSRFQLERIGELIEKEKKADLTHDLKFAASKVSDFIFKNYIKQFDGSDR